jgi:hypothetical protein
MKRLRRIGFLGVLTLSLGTSIQAGTVTGTFQGIADIEVQQFVLGQQVGPTASYESVPSTIGFTITAGANPGNGPFQFSLTNSVLSLNTATLPLLSLSRPAYIITFVTDGVPGQTDDSASAGMESSVYHAWALQAGVTLTDPTGEYIGPNGNGDPSGVLVTARYTYQPWDFSDTGQTYTVSFTTDPPADPPAGVPEPSSVVLATSGALLVFTVALGRARRASRP